MAEELGAALLEIDAHRPSFPAEASRRSASSSGSRSSSTILSLAVCPRDNAELAARHAESVGEQLDDLGVRPATLRRGVDPDLPRLAEAADDLRAARARVDAEAEARSESSGWGRRRARPEG